MNYLGLLPHIPPEERNGFDLYLTNQQDENTMYACVHAQYTLVSMVVAHTQLKEVYMLLSLKLMLVCTLHVCLGGLSNDDQIMNWNKTSMVCLLTKQVSVSKYETCVLV